MTRKQILKSAALTIPCVSVRMLADCRAGHVFVLTDIELSADRVGNSYRYFTQRLRPEAHAEGFLPPATEDGETSVTDTYAADAAAEEFGNGGERLLRALETGEEIRLGAAVAATTNSGYGIRRPRRHEHDLGAVRARTAREFKREAQSDGSWSEVRKAVFTHVAGAPFGRVPEKSRRKFVRQSLQAIEWVARRWKTGVVNIEDPRITSVADVLTELRWNARVRGMSIADKHVFNRVAGKPVHKFGARAGYAALEKVRRYEQSVNAPIAFVPATPNDCFQALETGS